MQTCHPQMGNLALRLAKRMRALRGGQSQLQFCKRVGLSQSSYNRIEMGQQNVTLKTLDILCQRLKCTPGFLIDPGPADMPLGSQVKTPSRRARKM